MASVLPMRPRDGSWIGAGKAGGGVLYQYSRGPLSSLILHRVSGMPFHTDKYCLSYIYRHIKVVKWGKLND